jgi:hypothetical protein
MPPPVRRIVAAACGILGALLIFAAFLLGYATQSVFNERVFAARVDASLEDPRVAGYVAEQVVDAVIRAKPDLVGVRPVLVGVVRGAVSSPPFRAAIRRGARLAHAAIMSGTGSQIVLGVQDLDVVLESMTATHPALANKIPPRLTASLDAFESLPAGEQGVQLLRLARRLRAGTVGLLLLGAALCAACVWLAADRRRALVRVGVGLAGLGLVLAIVSHVGGHALGFMVREASHAGALAGVASAFLAGLQAWGLVLMFTGLVLAAGASSLLERVVLRHMSRQLLEWLAGDQPLMRFRLLRAVVWLLTGAALLFWPIPTLIVVAWAMGLAIAFVGLREGFVAALHLLPEIEASRGTGAGRTRASRAMPILVAVALVLLGGAMWMILRSDATPPEPHTITACNGSAALCDRRLDQVMFATSHNSMSGADLPGWMFPNQDAGIKDQLADGVRGFMLDVHYGVPVRDKVKTELKDELAAMAKYEAALGKEGMEAVLRIRERLAGEEQGARGIYLCHGFCELGAAEFVPALRDMRDFLVAHPGEVLIVVIQDESVTPQDVERSFEESGLIDFVYRGPARPPWPTLREMIATDQRVVVMAENDTAGVAWYHPAFQVMQETPYTFHDPSEFSNKPNRGGTGGSLLLMNHWIETTPMPKPSNAAIVNARDALIARIRDFRRERGRLPNLVAVDFYRTGDLVQVVHELNAEPLPAGRRTTAGRLGR